MAVVRRLAYGACFKKEDPMSSLRIKLNAVRPDLAPHLEKSVESVPHVQSVRVDVGESAVIVEHDGANPDEVLRALRQEGFEPRPE